MSEQQNKKSHQAFLEAKQVLVGGVNSPARAFLGVGGDPVFFKKANGALMTSIEGKTYVDFVGSWGPMILGHNHPEVVSAISKTLQNGTSFGAPTLLETEMARDICKCFDSIEKVRMVNSGTEAALSVIRLARGATKRKYIIKFEGCYHGHGDSFLEGAGSGVATLKIKNSGVPKEFSQLTLLARFNDFKSVQTLMENHKDEVAAIILEPVVGNMGLVPPKDGFLKDLRELSKQHGTLLIFDEVMTGFRLSIGGAQKLYGIKPDLTCLGKIIGGGLPVGAYGGRADLMSFISPEGPVYQAGTLSGNPLAMASGKATLNHLMKNPKIYDDLEKSGALLEKGLCQLGEKYNAPIKVQRVGSMMTVFFNDQKAPVENYDHAKACDTELFGRFFHKMLDRGFYLPPSQFEAAFLSTALTQKHLEDFLKAAEEAFKELF